MIDLKKTKNLPTVSDEFGGILYGTWYDEEKHTNGDFWFSHQMLSFGDYDNSCHLERSNVRVFLEMFADKEGQYEHFIGSYGHEAILVRHDCTDKEILEVLTALCNGACLDSGDVRLMVREMIEERLEDFLRDDLSDKVREHFPVDIGNVDDELLKIAFLQLEDYYPEIEAGGIVYFPDFEEIQARRFLANLMTGRFFR